MTTHHQNLSSDRNKDRNPKNARADDGEDEEGGLEWPG